MERIDGDGDWCLDDDTFSALCQFLDDPATLDLGTGRHTCGPPCSSTAVVVDPTRPLRVQVQRDLAQAFSGHAKTRRSGARRSYKIQIEELRFQTMHLEQNLSAARERIGDTDSYAWSMSLVDSEWEKVAAQELNYRRRAEAENIRLRGALRDQQLASRAISRLLARERQISHKYEIERTFEPEPRVARSFRTEQDEIDFAVLTTALAEMYTQTDSVFADPRLDWLTAPLQHVSTEQSDGAFAVQWLDARIVPFDVEATAPAVWQNLIRRASYRECGLHEDLDDDDTLSSQYEMTMQHRGNKAHLHTKMVLRRIVEKDRVVFLRVAVFTHADQAEASLFRGVPMRHLMWTVVERPRHAELREQSSRTAACQVQSCGISIPTLAAQGDDTERETISSFCISVSREQSVVAQEEVDNFLLSRGARTASAC